MKTKIPADSLESVLLPEYKPLTAFDYAIFGSLDFASPTARKAANEKLRTELFRKFILSVSRRTRIRRRYFQHFLTDEWNATGGEKHLHFVMPSNARLCGHIQTVVTTMNDVWENELQVGRCKVEPFDQQQKDKCLRYICKRQTAWKRGRKVELEKEAYVSKEFSRWMRRNDVWSTTPRHPNYQKNFPCPCKESPKGPEINSPAKSICAQS